MVTLVSQVPYVAADRWMEGPIDGTSRISICHIWNIFISLFQDQFVCSDYRMFEETRINDPSWYYVPVDAESDICV